MLISMLADIACSRSHEVGFATVVIKSLSPCSIDNTRMKLYLAWCSCTHRQPFFLRSTHLDLDGVLILQGPPRSASGTASLTRCAVRAARQVWRLWAKGRMQQQMRMQQEMQMQQYRLMQRRSQQEMPNSLRHLLQMDRGSQSQQQSHLKRNSMRRLLQLQQRVHLTRRMSQQQNPV